MMVYRSSIVVGALFSSFAFVWYALHGQIASSVMMDFKTKPGTGTLALALALACALFLLLFIIEQSMRINLSLVRCSLAMENSVGDGGR